MHLLTTLLQKCVKRREMAFLLPYDGISTVMRARLEEMWASDNFRRDIYNSYCATCTCRADCKLISYRHWSRKNVIINTFGNNEEAETEIIVFKNDLKCIDELKNVEFDGGANYVLMDDGVLFPKDENIRNWKFIENMANSARQSIDKYWGYALSNDWDYFITLTADKKKVGDRYDDDNIKHFWRTCRRRLQAYDPGVKILLIPERHKDGALHFHGFVSMEKTFLLREALDEKTKKPMRSKVNTPLFVFPFWDSGLSTCAIIKMDKFDEQNEKPESEEDFKKSRKRRLAAYLSKYVMKANIGSEKKDAAEIGYRQKRFYHTQNLEFKNKELLYLDRQMIDDITADYELYKENDTQCIYRMKYKNTDN